VPAPFRPLVLPSAIATSRNNSARLWSFGWWVQALSALLSGENVDLSSRVRDDVVRGFGQTQQV
jgi:hypothetical protein